MKTRLAILGVLAAGTLTALLGTQVSVVAQDESTIRITGRVVEDIDGDGQISAGDRGGETLIDLERVGDETLLASVNTDSSGNFAFNFGSAPTGSYRVWVWWTPGFIDAATDVAPSLTIEQPHAGLRKVAVTDAQVSAATAQGMTFLVNPRRGNEGVFPVRTGEGPVPVGEATVGSAGLPGSGTGADGAGAPWAASLAVAGFAAVGVATVAFGVRRRKRA